MADQAPLQPRRLRARVKTRPIRLRLLRPSIHRRVIPLPIHQHRFPRPLRRHPIPPATRMELIPAKRLMSITDWWKFRRPFEMGRSQTFSSCNFQTTDRTSQQINAIAMPYLQQEAIQVQSANVDIISGATLTSEGFQMSLQSALANAH